jgi:hypothetical protein
MRMRDTRTKHEFDCTSLGIFGETALECPAEGPVVEHNLDFVQVYHPQYHTWTDFWIAVDVFVQVYYYNPKVEMKKEGQP